MVTESIPTVTVDGCRAADGWWVSGTLSGLGLEDSMTLCQMDGQYMLTMDGAVYPTCVAYGDPQSACGDSDLVCPENPNNPGYFGWAGNQRSALAEALTRADMVHPACPTSTCKSMDMLADSGEYWKNQLLNNPYTPVTEDMANNVCVTEDNQVFVITREKKCNTCLGWAVDAAQTCDSNKFICAGHSGTGYYTYGWPGQSMRTLAVALANADGDYMHPQCPLGICAA